jgi:hypothetical protein
MYIKHNVYLPLRRRLENDARANAITVNDYKLPLTAACIAVEQEARGFQLL